MTAAGLAAATLVDVAVLARLSELAAELASEVLGMYWFRVDESPNACTKL